MNRRYHRGQNKTAFVAVRHNDRTDQTSGNPPGRGVSSLQNALVAKVFYIKRRCKILSQIMGRTRLQTLTVVHHRFHRIRCDRARKFFLFRLSARQYGDCKTVFGKFFVNIEHRKRFFFRFRRGCMRGMTFLPQKFACTKERTSRLFPTHNVAPLINFQGQITIGLHPFCHHRTDNRFGRRTNCQRLGKLFPARMRYHRHFRRKTFHVLRFFRKITHRNKQGEVCVFHTTFLKTRIHLLLDIFPNCIAVWPNDHRALNGSVIHEFRF